MPWRPEENDDFDPDDQDADPEGPQACDLQRHDDDDTVTVPCPHCGHDIAELAERCPHCGDWIIPGDARLSTRGLVWAIVALLLVLTLLYWLV